MKDKLFILDGYGLIYRAFFALASRHLTDSNGNNVSAVYGFFRTIFFLEKNYGARRIAVAMDTVEPTHRHKLYPDYKATRDAAPEDLHAQIPIIRDILECLGIPAISVEGYEADDVIGSMAEICRREARSCSLVSADKDLMQLVDENVRMLKPKQGGGFQEIGPEQVLEEKGVRPDQMVDYLALIGDSSDNIRGVEGIGEKTAAALLAKWDNLDSLYKNIDEAAKGVRLLKLKEGKESAYFSRKLVRIVRNLALEDEIASVDNGIVDFAAAAREFRKRNMITFAREAAELAGYNATEIKTRLEVGKSGAPEVNYSPILNREQMDKWGERILESGLVALDTETDNLDPMLANLIGISVSVSEGKAGYLPIKCADCSCMALGEVVDWLNGILVNGRIRVVGQNFKYDLKVLRRVGVRLENAWFDTMIAAWVIDASSPVGMDALCDRYLGFSTIKFDDVVPKGSTFDSVGLKEAVAYAAEDADVTLRLYRVFEKILKSDPKRASIFWEIEMPLLPILTAMEIEGIGLEFSALESYGEELGREIDSVVSEIHNLCGREFNVASPKQLQEVLFQERGLKPGKKTKMGYSTDNTVLMNLAREDPMPEKILFYRSLSKLKSTYVDVLPRLVYPGDGRIHTSYSQVGAATGRLSSNNPNLQNIPVRDENGRRIRRAFRSRDGYTFISVDYSQIELVVLAHMSGDWGLAKAFNDGVDVHVQTAAQLFGVDASDVMDGQRRMAKAVNFGVMYGMSAFRLSNELNISRKEANQFIETYFATYEGIGNFINQAVSDAEADGGTRTLYGRFRPLPGINSRNKVEKAASERAAVNTRIQGTAADIMKKAMIEVNEVLMNRFSRAKMLLQVHDELLIESPIAIVSELKVALKDTMENVVKLTVPLRVSVETGDSWGDIH
ncbi:DNA polymerase I [Olavius algarvensis spirochete endosymbiont]|uniref:DNA polymerase I n=1 Tax=Olavius algarvensis spirochete endosymbiont TaxID=260710 RepID=UPI000F2CD036|nr:DNA polymerase I [Olavius algarvensis spirochete endosymbiont]CAD7837335.1 MAG: DNA polymerase I (EC 2.7.7.7) [Olavius algarvensis spirochete endosymbiont]VDB00709.1 DNA polymerase I [Olavius algarvensis spirochete endosymbiont]